MARNKNPRLKRSNVEIEYSLEMIQELDRCSIDPIYFIENYVYIKGVKGKSLFKLFDYQKEMIKGYLENKRIIVLASRQVGKTETSAAYILWFSIFHKEKTILIASNKSDNAKEIIGKVVFAYEELPDWIKPGINENTWNKFSLEFENRSRIIAATTAVDTGRGLTIDLLYVDELAFVKPHIQDQFFTSILPTLASREDAKMIISSTPNGDINLFANIWRAAQAKVKDAFFSIFVPWYAMPGRDEKYKQRMIAQFGHRRWRQEFECEFLSSEHTLIDTMIINQIEAKNRENDIKPIFQIDEFDFWKSINRGNSYIVSVDLSEGGGDDYSVIEVFEFPTMEQTAEYSTNNTSPAMLYGKLKNILRYLEHYAKDVYFSVENNSLGQSIVALYEADMSPPEKSFFVFEKGKDKLGIATTSKSKPKSCLLLKEMIIKDQMKIYSEKLLTELKSYVRKAGSYKAQTGSTDDHIAATLIALRIVEELAEFDESAYHKLYISGLEAIEEMDNSQWDVEEEYDDDDAPLPVIFV